MKKLNRYIDIVVAQNSETYDSAKRINKGKNDVRIIKSGVNLKDFRPRSKNYILGEMRIPKSMFVVTYMGRMSEEKNPDIFVEIAKNIKDDDIFFVMAGDGPLFTNIQEKVRRNKSFLKNFYLPGFVASSRVSLLLRMFWLFLLLSTVIRM